MLVRELRSRPRSWGEYRQGCAPIALPFRMLEWVFEWGAYYLSRWAFLEVLEYLSILSVLVAVTFYFAESGDRKKQKHYQAWQVINTAQGKGGSGGRIEALQELNLDHVPLVGVNAAGAFLQGVQLRRANLLRADLEAADLRDSNLEACNLEFSSLRWANFRHADLRGADFANADLSNGDLAHADLTGADLRDANLENADLHDANLRDIRWRDIRSIEKADIQAVRNPPDGFRAWALAHGAASVAGSE